MMTDKDQTHPAPEANQVVIDCQIQINNDNYEMKRRVVELGKLFLLKNDQEIGSEDENTEERDASLKIGVKLEKCDDQPMLLGKLKVKVFTQTHNSHSDEESVNGEICFGGEFTEEREITVYEKPKLPLQRKRKYDYDIPPNDPNEREKWVKAVRTAKHRKKLHNEMLMPRKITFKIYIKLVECISSCIMTQPYQLTILSPEWNMNSNANYSQPSSSTSLSFHHLSEDKSVTVATNYIGKEMIDLNFKECSQLISKDENGKEEMDNFVDELVNCPSAAPFSSIANNMAPSDKEVFGKDVTVDKCQQGSVQCSRETQLLERNEMDVTHETNEEYRELDDEVVNVFEKNVEALPCSFVANDPAALDKENCDKDISNYNSQLGNVNKSLEMECHNKNDMEDVEKHQEYREGLKDEMYGVFNDPKKKHHTEGDIENLKLKYEEEIFVKNNEIDQLKSEMEKQRGENNQLKRKLYESKEKIEHLEEECKHLRKECRVSQLNEYKALNEFFQHF